MVRRLFASLAVLSVLFVVTPVFSEEIESFRVSQAVDKYPEVTVYADAMDISGSTVTDLQPSDIVATLGQYNVTTKKIEAFEATGEGVAYVFLVDVSRSLSMDQFDSIRSAIGLWIDKMREQDRAAIISFGENVTVTQDYTADKKALKNGLLTLGPTDNKTRFHRGIHRAIELSRRGDESLPTRRVIITLSDGEDDFAGGMTREEVLASMAEDRVPIYAIGYSNSRVRSEESLKKLGEFARTSGGEFFEGNTNDIASLYEGIQAKILSSLVITIDATTASADGNVHHLQLNLKSGDKTFKDGLDIRVLPVASSEASTQAEEPKIWYEEIPWWAYVIAGAIVVLFILLMVNNHRKNKARLLAEEAEEQERREKELAEQKAAEDAANAVSSQQDDAQTVKVAKQPGINMKFVVLSHSGDSREYGVRLSTRTIVGRSSECDLTIDNDDEVSKRHCEFLLEEGYVLLNDLNSTNGTYINGVPVKVGHRVKNGDLIMLGRTEMRVMF